jgi:hypothetical protein
MEWQNWVIAAYASMWRESADVPSYSGSDMKSGVSAVGAASYALMLSDLVQSESRWNNVDWLAIDVVRGTNSGHQQWKSVSWLQHSYSSGAMPWRTAVPARAVLILESDLERGHQRLVFEAMAGRSSPIEQQIQIVALEI